VEKFRKPYPLYFHAQDVETFKTLYARCR